MKHLPLIILLLLLFGCKEFGEGHKPETDLIENPISPKEKTNIPEGALKANFIEHQDSFYAFVKNIDASNNTTLVSFENEQLPEITIPESLGAQLSILKLKNFPNDVLLVNAMAIDTNFNEYYLYVWKDSEWKQPVNHFYIHKSNITDTLIPIKNNLKDSMQLDRYYSVFNMERVSEKKYSWSLVQESVPIEE